MAPQRLDIHHFHIVHNTPYLSPKFCKTIVSNFPWVQWLGKILKGEQGALWSMWKKWINSRNMIILLATKKMLCHQYGMHQSCSRCFSIFEHLLLTQMRLCRRDSKYTLYENCTCEAQFSNLVKPHSGTSDQSNQSPSQPGILTNSQSGQ